MEPKPVSRQRTIFLAALTLGVVAFIVAAVLLSGSDHGKSAATGGPSSSSQPDQVGRVAKTLITGLHGDTYFGQTIKFVVPSGIADIQRLGESETSDQLIFDLDGGHGTITSQPNDTSMSLAELKRFYSGKKQKFEIAGADGFMFDQSNGSVDSVTAIAYVGPQMVTIQLAGENDEAKLEKLVVELGGAIQIRRAPASAGE